MLSKEGAPDVQKSASLAKKIHLLPLTLLISLSSCSIESRPIQPEPEPEIEAEPEQIPWRAMTLVVRGAQTRLSKNGHFTTVPTACYRRENGALEANLWNQINSLTDRLLKQPWLEETQCSPRPERSPELYKPVIIEFNDRGPLELFSMKGKQFCSRSADLKTAEELLMALGQVALQAYYEGCPRPPRESSTMRDETHSEQPASALGSCLLISEHHCATYPESQ